jgi:PAS domain S-box-containing protein
VARDITDRRAAEERIRQSEERLQLGAEALRSSNLHLQVALTAARLGSWEWNTETNTVECSDQCRAILGLPHRSSLSFEAVFGVIHPEDQERVRNLLESSIREDTVFEAQFRVNRRDGGLRWVLSSGSVMRDQEQKVVRMVGVSLDITERKRYDAERDELLRSEQAARQDAEAANHAKDQFLAMVSHELRTPLSAILGWARLLQAKKLDPGMTTKALEVIERSVVTQSRMIEDLLDFSRIVAGKLRLSAEEVDVSEIIRSVVESLGPTADAGSVTIEASQLASGLKVNGDPLRLQQVMHNLVSNAMKFTPAGGRVSITADAEGGIASIRVCDTGAGISKTFLPYVFESFRQAERGGTRRHGGLGLGLAIVKHLVEMHRGTVSADSPGPGLGATFTVDLPLAKAADTVEQQLVHTMRKGFAEGSRSDELKGLRILVVDDQAAVRKMLKAYLERQGAEVRPSATADEAIEELMEWRPDVLLSDIAMPDEDGLALISRVRLLDSVEARDVLAIALTVHTRVEDRLRALSAGFQFFVSKHVEPAELVSTIATLVKNKS